MSDDEFDFESSGEFGGLEFEPTAAVVDSKYRSIVEEWSKGRPYEERGRFVCEDGEDGAVTVELWGKELMIYVPEDDESNIFVTTEDEDSGLYAALLELNDMPHLRSLPELLSQASKMLSGKIDRVRDALTLGRFTTEASSDHGSMVPTVLELSRGQSALVLNFDDLSKKQDEIICKCSVRHGLSWSDAALLLLHAKWDDELLSRRLETDRHEIYAAAGVVPHTVGSVKHSPALCCVCFVDEAVSCLPCGHGLCADDWPGFLKCNLDSGTVSGKNCLRLRCPGDRCRLHVPPHVFEKFLEEADFVRYKKLWLLSFVNDNKRIVWCPGDGCELCVGFSRRQSSVTCECGHTFCFSCKLAAHAPVKCSNAKVWLERKEDISVSASAESSKLSDNKKCPNPECGVIAHKVSGCMYLQCPTCEEAWCWQCGDWGGGPSGRPPPHHVSECNDPVNASWAKVSTAVLQGNDGRYLFYKERYDNHMASLAFAEKLRTSVKEIIEEMLMGDVVPVSAAQCLRDAAELLIECRLVLAWTYAFAFFESRDADRRLFEFAQKDLEKMTEQLSAMIEDRSPAEVLQEYTRLRDFIPALKGYLENIKGYTIVDAEEDDVIETPIVQAKAKGKAKPTAKAKVAAAVRARSKQRPRQQR
eukprot:TRINITY_DN70234_c0_g1_i1.p1 TRINITY_DN70234_c0_g1~~TRINITY_DN70234_c0_g1_i1.p1  ORF type:complete len:644 (-),score=111.16 TRINITY_DN70234_c0_g1_i1:74-2005(-)